jgi:hypothetical protein
MTQPGDKPRSKGFFATFWRVVRQVFHESTGAVFLILALFWSLAALQKWRAGAETWSWGALGAFALMFAGFGVSSFLSARRVR